MSSITYLAQRVNTNEWLSFDLPLTEDGPPHCHTNYDVMKATISPELANMRADDGRLVLLKWGTWIHVETPGERVWTGIVDDVYAVGAVMHVSIREWQGWLHGNTFLGKIWGVEDDPADLVRDLWSQMSILPNGALGVEVVGSVPNVRLGTKWDDVVIATKYRLHAAKLALKPYDDARKKIERRIKSISAKHDKLINPKVRALIPFQRDYREHLRVKEADPVLIARKENAKVLRDGKRTDPAILAYKAEAEIKNSDTTLRDRKWNYDDEVDLKKIDSTLQSLKAAYEYQRDNGGSTQAIKDAKAAYDARNAYWTARIAPFKASYEERRDYWDSRLKPLRRPNDLRVFYWDALIRQADNLLQQRVTYWDDRLKPYRVAVESRQKVITELRDAKSDELQPYQDDLEDARNAALPFQDVVDKESEQLKIDEAELKKYGGAYQVLANDKPDAWRVLLDLAKAGLFEFTTQTVKTNGPPILRLIIHPGRAGRTRNDLVFEQGRNIIEQPEIRENDDYASEVIGVGAGQGESVEGYKQNLQRTIGEVDAFRLYRNAVYSDPSVTNAKVLEYNTRADLARRRTGPHLPEIVVQDDENCKIGSWEVGDIINPKMSKIPHYGNYDGRMRIRSWQRVGTDRARLILEEP